MYLIINFIHLRWKLIDVTLAPSDREYFQWLPTLKTLTTSSPKAEETETTTLLGHDQRENKSEVASKCGSFKFDLYSYDNIIVE